MSEGQLPPRKTDTARPPINQQEKQKPGVISGPVGVIPSDELTLGPRITRALQERFAKVPDILTNTAPTAEPKISRLAALGTLGAAATVGLGIWQRRRIGNMISPQGNSHSKSPTTATNESSALTQVQEKKGPLLPPERRLSLSQLVEIVSGEKQIDTSAISDRLDQLTSASGDHVFRTLDSVDGKYKKTDEPVLGIYQVVSEINIRDTPSDRSKKTLTIPDTETAGEFFTTGGYFLGMDVLGNMYEGAGEWGHLWYPDTRDSGGAFVSILDARKNEDGTWRARPNDYFADKAGNNDPSLPSAAAPFGIRAVSLEEAREVLNNT